MARPTSKTPAQIADEAEQRAIRARERAIKVETASNPLLAKLDAAINAASKEIAACSRKMNGPNSFDNRLESLALHRNFIESEQFYTTLSDKASRELKTYLQSSLSDIASKIAKGENPTQSDVDTILGNAPTNDELATARDRMESDSAAWREFIASRKDAKPDTTPMETAASD